MWVGVWVCSDECVWVAMMAWYLFVVPGRCVCCVCTCSHTPYHDIRTLTLPPHTTIHVFSTIQVSTFTFDRLMPLSAAALRKAGGVKFRKHVRAGENTFPNMVSVMTGRFP